METGVNNLVSPATIVALFIFLAVLLILLFVLYKYLNKQANGKYTVERVVLREGGLRDRARGAAVALGNRLGVQLWPQSETDEENGEYEDEEDEDEEEEANSNRNESSDEEDDDVVQVNEQKSGSMTEGNNAEGSSGGNSVDSLDEEEEQAEAKPEPESKAEAGKRAEDKDVQENKAEETNAPIVIGLHQFSGSVLWSEEDKCEGGDVTAL